MVTAEQHNNNNPLVVDLDGTLIRADMLWEGLFRVLRRRPLRLFALLRAVPGGRAAFKAAVALEADIDPARLPWNEAVIQTLHGARRRGRRLWLATAANQRMADQVAQHLDLFERVFASSDTHNLKGGHKLAALEEAAPEGFDYIGDAVADMPIFLRAGRAWTVGPWAEHLAQRAARHGAHISPLPGVPAMEAPSSALLRLIRPHQWLKNGLVFLPLIAGHHWFDGLAVSNAVVAFVAFCLFASSAYVFNDLLDVEHDRVHPRKRYRPIASGAVPQPLALVVVPGLLVLALGLAVTLPWAATAVLVCYFLLTMAYTLVLKRIAVLDILTLTALYNLRILGGGAATGIDLSYWLVGFTLFLFFGLGVMKRVTEVQQLSHNGASATAGRGYRAGDEWMLIPLGIACSVAAALVLGLYASSQDVVDLYARPIPLLLIVPLILLWQSGLWLQTIRGHMHDDPLVYAVRDRSTWVIGALIAVLFLAAL